MHSYAGVWGLFTQSCLGLKVCWLSVTHDRIMNVSLSSSASHTHKRALTQVLSVFSLWSCWLWDEKAEVANATWFIYKEEFNTGFRGCCWGWTLIVYSYWQHLWSSLILNVDILTVLYSWGLQQNKVFNLTVTFSTLKRGQGLGLCRLNLIAPAFNQKSASLNSQKLKS